MVSRTLLYIASIAIPLAAAPSASGERSDARKPCHRLPSVELPAAREAAMTNLLQPVEFQTSGVACETLPSPADFLVNDTVRGPVGVDHLVATALRRNPEIQAARYRASALLSRVPQARAFDDPMLTTTAFLEPIQTAAGPQDAILNLSQKFPWFGKRNSRGEIAYYDAQVAFADLADVELAVVEQVKLAYYDLYFLYEAGRIYRDLRPQIEELITSAQQRYEASSDQVGLESVLEAEIRLREFDIQIVKIDQGKRKAAARLAQAIHLPQGAFIDIEPQMGEAMEPKQVDVLVGMLEYCHPQLDARRDAISRNRWRVDLARRDFFPDATVGFNWWAIGEQGLSAVANGRDAYALTAGINLPIYLGKRRAALREARLQSGQSSQEYEATWDALRSDVEQNYADVKEQEEILRILDVDILAKAKQTFDLSLSAYQFGRIDFQQLIYNYETLQRLQVEYYLRKASREQAIARLERSVGCAIMEPQSEVANQK